MLLCLTTPVIPSQEYLNRPPVLYALPKRSAADATRPAVWAWKAPRNNRLSALRSLQPGTPSPAPGDRVSGGDEAVSPKSDSWQRMAGKLREQLLLNAPAPIDHDLAGRNNSPSVLRGTDVKTGNAGVEVHAGQPVNRAGAGTSVQKANLCRQGLRSRPWISGSCLTGPGRDQRKTLIR